MLNIYLNTPTANANVMTAISTQGLVLSQNRYNISLNVHLNAPRANANVMTAISTQGLVLSHNRYSILLNIYLNTPTGCIEYKCNDLDVHWNASFYAA